MKKLEPGKTETEGNWLALVIILSIVVYSWKEIGGLPSAPMNISDTTCIQLQNNAQGAKLKNIFGGSFEVLDVRNSIEISRSHDKLVCVGDLILDNGNDSSKLRMELKIDSKGSFYKYSQIFQ